MCCISVASSLMIARISALSAIRFLPERLDNSNKQPYQADTSSWRLVTSARSSGDGAST